MLSELYIKNLAIIEEAKISFTDGLNILTGETGTGKSIIINAISFLCGGRASTSFIGKRSDTAFIEGAFYLTDYEIEILNKKIEILNLDIMIEDDLLIVSRTINRNGRSVSKINNRVVNNSNLSEIMLNILNVCGQHDSYTLFNRTNFVDVLDSFSDDDFKLKLKDVENTYNQIKEVSLKIKKLKLKADNFDDNIVEMESKIAELESLNLENLNEEELENEIEKYSNSKNIIKACSNLLELFNSENSDVNLFSILSDVSKNLKEIENYDKNFKILDKFEDISFEIKEIFTKLETYYNGIYIDEESLSILQERYNLLNDLKNRYKKDKKALIEYRDFLYEEIYILKNSKQLLENTNESIKKLKSEYLSMATKISNLRKSIASKLEKMIERELLDLDLKNSIFRIDVHSNNKITNIGFDDVNFLISTNKGEELKEIYKVASGGEMSRIMLGFKKVLSDRDKISTLIFDEIDSGISGVTAQIVGEKLVEISKNHQLIVISHLPQISVLSDTHFIISKETFDDTTLSKIEIASEDDKILEISRLIGGANINDITLKQSKEMIKLANDVKEKLRCIEK